MARYSTSPGGLNLGGGATGRLKEYLLIIALAVIIIGSLVVTIMYGWSSDDDKQTASKKMMLKCLECQAESEFDPKVPPPPPVKGQLATHTATFACPKCKRAASALMMTKCPNPKCGKYYLSQTTLHNYQTELMMAAGQDISKRGSAPPTVCTDCGTDY